MFRLSGGGHQNCITSSQIRFLTLLTTYSINPAILENPIVLHILYVTTSTQEGMTYFCIQLCLVWNRLKQGQPAYHLLYAVA